MAQIAKKSIQKVLTAQTQRQASSAVVAFSPQENALTERWLDKIKRTSSTHASIDAQSQLSSVLDYFNKKSSNQGLAAIDWKHWEESVHTKEVVGKIKAKYEEFMKHEYNVDAAASLIGTRSEKMKQLEFVNTYNSALWYVHFFLHLNQMETLRNIGDPSALSITEWLHLNQPIEIESNIDPELGNLAPSSAVEHGIYSRISTQFTWGTRYAPPFVHSSDAINSVVATMAKLGK